MTVNGTDIDIDVPQTKEATRYRNSVQLIHEIREVRNCLLKGRKLLLKYIFMYLLIHTTYMPYSYISGLKESTLVPWSLSIENAGLIEEIRKQLGVAIN